MIYENHMLENERLPFIFHLNIVTDKTASFGNWHENPEFLFFTGGSGTVMCNKHNYDVSADDLAIINSDCLHAISSCSRVEYFCLIVDTGFFQDNGIPLDSFTPLVKAPHLRQIFERIALLYREKPDWYCAKIRAEVLNLMIYITENYRAEENSAGYIPQKIKDAVTYIKSNYNSNISIDDIVKHVGFSRAYFSREFKKNTGVSLITYLNYIRCSQARAMLGSGRSSVSEAAEACGFQNLSYFSKTYRRLMGILPSEDMKNSDGTKSENRSDMYVLENNIRIR